MPGISKHAPLRWLAVASVMALSAPVVAADAPLAAPPPIRFTVERYEVSGENPLREEQVREVLSPFTGPQEGLDGLVKAAEALGKALQRAGFPFHRATLPPQTMEGGVVRLEVAAARVGSVTIEGNSLYDDSNIRRTVPSLKEGDTPDMQALSRSLAMANQHPTRQVTLTFKDASESGELGAQVDVQEKRLWTVFSTFNNIGTPQPGRARLTLGAQYTNFFNRDHIGTVSYTTAPESVEDVVQLGLNYRIPFYRTGTTLNLFHNRSDVTTGVIEAGDAGGNFNVSGAGRFTGLLLSQTLPSLGAYRESITLGLDDRLFLNDVTETGVNAPVLGDVRSRPLTLGYEGLFRAARWNASFRLSWSRNLEGGDRNEDINYAQSVLISNAARATGAPRAGWDVARFFGQAGMVLPLGLELRGIFEGQWADQPLIAGERFGAGGFASVRGFEERAISGDKGARLSMELYTPVLPYGIRGLWFTDAGHSSLDSPSAGSVPSETIISTGFGLRWSWRQQLAVQFDHGQALKGVDGSSGGGYKTHVFLSYRY